MSCSTRPFPWMTILGDQLIRDCIENIFILPGTLFSAPHFNGRYCGAAWKGAREDFSGCRGRQALIQPPPQADILIRGGEGPQFHCARRGCFRLSGRVGLLRRERRLLDDRSHPGEWPRLERWHSATRGAAQG